MKTAFSLLLVLLLVASPVIAASSDDPDRPANAQTNIASAPKAKIVPRIKGYFERLQGRVGLEKNCEITELGGEAYCATDKSRTCPVLREGAFVNGHWAWCVRASYHGEIVCAAAGHDDPSVTCPTRLAATHAPKRVSSNFEPATPKASVPKSRPPKATPAPSRPQKTVKRGEARTSYGDRTEQASY